MNEFTIHPQVYSTGRSRGLISLLERVWIRETELGKGSFYIVSGFGNYNGGVRFFPVFKHHIEKGGKVSAIFGGSTSQRLTSKQVVEELLTCGASVYVINRKRLLHAKFYGSSLYDNGESLIVTSGNFTGPGMSQNVEVSLLLDKISTKDMGFSWNDTIDSLLRQNWDIYKPSLADRTTPAWQLLYDETAGDIVLDQTEEVTMVMTLGHPDTVRVNAEPGSTEAKGTQYFWLSKDCYDFFPPLTILNKRGIKKTYSCIIKLYYIDLGVIDSKCRVTFEAENNFDFRFGTGKLRYTKAAKRGDLVAISRIGEAAYEMRIFKRNSSDYKKLIPYAINYIGHKGKKYGYISNEAFEDTLGIRLASN